MRRFYLYIQVLMLLLIPHLAHCWGNYGHMSISSSAIECLPYDMATVFRPYKRWIADTSTDNGVRTGWAPNEQYFHYIDTDLLPGCQWPFTCVPRNYGSYTISYGITNGTNPYMVDSLTIVLSTAYRNWDNNKTGSNMTTALYWMCRIAHYVEDLHQPLHVTEDYDPNGVHSRYESNMLNTFKPSVATSLGSGAIYQSNPLEFAFSIISTVYPYHTVIANSDIAAENQAGNTSNSTYYTLLWSSTQSFTTTFLNMAAKNVASIWYTAWINGGLIATPVELSEFTTSDISAIKPSEYKNP